MLSNLESLNTEYWVNLLILIYFLYSDKPLKSYVLFFRGLILCIAVLLILSFIPIKDFQIEQYLVGTTSFIIAILYGAYFFIHQVHRLYEILKASWVVLAFTGLGLKIFGFLAADFFIFGSFIVLWILIVKIILDILKNR